MTELYDIPPGLYEDPPGSSLFAVLEGVPVAEDSPGSGLYFDEYFTQYVERLHPLLERAYVNLGPWSRADESGQLLEYMRALLSPLIEVDDLVRDSDTHSGWGVLLDVDNAPDWALSWLAQFVGVTTVPGLDSESQRINIKKSAGFSRGTPASIVAAAKLYLTGNRTVELYEREGSPWVFRLRTYSAETPFPQRVLDAVEALKPAGTVFIYELQEGVEIDGLSGSIDSLTGTIESYSSTTPI